MGAKNELACIVFTNSISLMDQPSPSIDWYQIIHSARYLWMGLSLNPVDNPYHASG